MRGNGWRKGVLHGSINMTDYFNIFLNDICFCLDVLCYIDNYADGKTLSDEDKDINVFVDNLEVASCEVVTWFDQNCMQANADKFQVRLFSRNPQITNITST